MAPDSLPPILLDAFDLVAVVDPSGAVGQLLAGDSALASEFTQLTVLGLALPISESALPATAELRGPSARFRGRVLAHEGCFYFAGYRQPKNAEHFDLAERHHHLFERTPLAVLVHADGVLQSVNPAARDLLDAADETELIGRSIADFFGVEIVGADGGVQFAPAGNGSEGPAAEFDLRTLKGRCVTVSCSSQAVVFGGRPAVQCIFEDLTQRRAMEAELLNERQLFEAAMNSMATAILVFNVDGQIEYANSSAANILGLPGVDLLLRGYNDPEWELTTLDGAPLADEDLPFARVRRTKRVLVDARHGVVRPDGQRRLLSVNGSPIINARGELTSLVFSLLDITDMIAAERQLRESEERLSLCIDGSRIGTWDWNCKTGEVRFDENWCAMLGYEFNEIQPNLSSWEKLAHPEDIARTMADLDLHFSGVTEIYRNEHRLKTKSGEWKWILDSGRVVSRDADGKPLRMLGTHLDIDPIKWAEQERHAMEVKVQKAARLESMSVLAGGVAHDFNNLLVGIIGAAGVALLDAEKDTTLYDTIKLIEAAGQRAANLTKQMLAFSGRGRFVMESVELAEVVKEMQDLLLSATSKRIPISYDLEPVSAIHADVSQMSQVLMNLVMNSVDACDRVRDDVEKKITIRTGEVSLTSSEIDELRWSFEVAPGDKVFLEVSDTGCGMDEATLSRIFEPFFSTKGAGHGLGLAAVIGIVRGHDGFIDVKTEKGRGTTFRVVFPRSESEPGPAFEEPNRETDPMRTKALIIDDEELVTTVMRVALKRHGYEVIVAADGRSGLAAFETAHAELAVVFLDMTMPGLSGPEVLKELKALDSDVPVIAMSGYSAEAAGVSGIKQDIAAFVQKPFRPDDLLVALSRIQAQD